MKPEGEATVAVTCSPGTESTPVTKEVFRGHWTLMLPFRPVAIAIAPVPSAEGRRQMARWCREMARECGRLAALLEAGARSRAEQDADLERLIDETGPEGESE